MLSDGVRDRVVSYSRFVLVIGGTIPRTAVGSRIRRQLWTVVTFWAPPLSMTAWSSASVSEPVASGVYARAVSRAEVVGTEGLQPAS